MNKIFSEQSRKAESEFEYGIELSKGRNKKHNFYVIGVFYDDVKPRYSGINKNTYIFGKQIYKIFKSDL